MYLFVDMAIDFTSAFSNKTIVYFHKSSSLKGFINEWNQRNLF